MWSLLLSPRGGIDRRAFWKGVFAALALGAAAASAASVAIFTSPVDATSPTALFQGLAGLLPLLLLAQLYSLFCLFMKRLRDAALGGWWSVVAIGVGLVAAWYAEIAVLGVGVAQVSGVVGWSVALTVMVIVVWTTVWLCAAALAGLPPSRQASERREGAWYLRSPSEPR